MLRSLKKLYGGKLIATDGEIGTIKDFYFDTQNWVIRYLVADTGDWLSGRKVLILPHFLATSFLSGKVDRVNLTRKKIEKSPSIDAHQPFSRQDEERHYKYYGRPPYWTTKATDMVGPQPESAASLRSIQAVNGYLVRVGDETIGYVCDFMMDTKGGKIGQLVVKTGHRFSEKDSLIPAKRVQRICYADSTIFAYANPETAGQIPANNLVPPGIVL